MVNFSSIILLSMNPKESVSISIIIPAWNESKTIKRVVKDAERVGRSLTKNFEIIVLDDSSLDNTLEILNNIDISELKVLHHKYNQGIEQSLRDLYKVAQNDLVFFNGADGDINMRVLSDFFKAMRAQKADIVVGNRVFKNYTVKRRIVSTLYNSLVWLMTGVRVYDAGTVKLVKATHYRSTTTKSKSVFAEAERLVRLVVGGAKLIKVDIYQNQNKINDNVSIAQLWGCFLDLIALSLELNYKRLMSGINKFSDQI